MMVLRKAHLSRKHDLHKEIFPSSINVNQLKTVSLVLYTGILLVLVYSLSHFKYGFRI